jgi:para-nitrobenzyl esterase
MIRLIASLVATLAVSAALVLAADPVRIDSGLLSGAPGTNPDVRVYKGIPFAAPPVGDLRWKAPQPVASWTGTKQATEFGAVCQQEPYAQNSPYYSPLGAIGEDCLYLNVWTPAKSGSEKHPVMVWVHGGGYTRGTGATATYNGEPLAQKGVVVVTINYRLGIFGFLAHPELTKESPHHASGNYGLLDQVAALQWVKKNIAAFGGDPSRVTIFGESAGSSAVNYLQASQLAHGLFHRVIGESGANFNRSLTREEAEQNGVKFGEKIGATSLAALRAKPAAELLKAGGSFRPNVDGYFLAQDVETIFAMHKQSDVPVIAGYNRDEGTTLSPVPNNLTAQSFADQAKQRYGKFADEYLKLYPAATQEQAMRAHYDSFRDAGMGWQMRTWVRTQNKSGKAPAYLYFFTRVPPGADKLGAYHASEIAYVFGNLGTRRAWEDADRKLSDVMSSYWANFAATGDPNGKGLPKWPAYSASSDESMIFGDTIKVQPNVNKITLDFFDRFTESQKVPKAGQATGGGN